MRAQGHYGLAGENSDCCIFICIQVWVCESLFIRQSIPWFTKHKFYILFTEPSAHWNLLADWAGQGLSVLTWDACLLKKPSGQGMEWCSQKWQGGGHRTVKNYDVICEPIYPQLFDCYRDMRDRGESRETREKMGPGWGEERLLGGD